LQKKLASNLREFHASYIDKANQKAGVCDAEAVANRIKQSPSSQQGQQQRREQQGSSEDSEQDEQDSYTYTSRGRRMSNQQQGGNKRQEQLASREDSWAPERDSDFFDNNNGENEDDDVVHGYGPREEQSQEYSGEQEGRRQRQSSSQGRKIKPKMATKVDPFADSLHPEPSMGVGGLWTRVLMSVGSMDSSPYSAGVYGLFLRTFEI
jgi:hypothetical protein